MGAVFSKVAPLILLAEGGEEKNKNDYGLETKYGISKREYPNEDIAALTPDRAMTILEADYWDHYRLSGIFNQSIANQVFLLLVNIDPSNATKIVQRAIAAVGGGIVRITIDGILGEATINALNMLAPGWLGDRIRIEACKYYLGRADEDPSQRVNIRGWIRRALM